ncbi:MAG: nucleotidyltransferase domain-containing protein [Nanoarchaeota archaeon]|nr:nucleotidyltransferase domain-containing protein [Nanoarchaeota archaeon]
MKKLLDEMRDELRPDSQPAELKGFLSKLDARLKKLKVKAKAVAGGSIAKGTFLKNDYDIDIFVMFDSKHKDKDLSDLLEKALKPFKPIRLHGSRDYFHIKGKTSYEIVPVLKITKPEQAENITDCSPLHVKWVKKHLTPRLADDIRLAKRFCKAQLCYGAESYISGFSGHVIDILIIHYKGFIPLLRAASRWSKQEVIDPERAHKGRALFNLNKSKLGPLVVIDPLQPERNAAAALSEEKFNRFRQAAAAFLKRPDRHHFLPQEMMIKKTPTTIIFNAKPDSDKHDVAGAQLRTAFNHLISESGRLGFIIKQSIWSWDKKSSSFILEFKQQKLSDGLIIKGPKARLKYHGARFRKAHKSVFEKNGSLYAKEKREVRTIHQLENHLSKFGLNKVKIKKDPRKSLCVKDLVHSHIFKYY